VKYIKVSQRRFDNQPLQLLTAGEAADFLNVKRTTLYVYASRGFVRSVKVLGTRTRRYVFADLQRLKARHDARSGHGPVAAGALQWGEPVLETEISSIETSGPSYRGHSAVRLAESGLPFESVAELLWTGELPSRTPSWSSAGFGLPLKACTTLLPAGTPPLAALLLALPALAARDVARFGATDAAEHARGRALILRLAASFALACEPRRAERAVRAGSVAAAVLHAVGLPSNSEQERALHQALVLCADHELNASTFAARVAASTGADLYASVTAALATLSGPRHGGECDRVEALVLETGHHERAHGVITKRVRRGETVPGFGHTLYPRGDPRAAVLLDVAQRLAPHSAAVRTVLALVAEMRASGREDPTLDIGLVALCTALGLPRGSAAGVFAIGRSAGWIAHALEQRAAGVLLRPRARYVGRLS
jgi:citrate synthase